MSDSIQVAVKFLRSQMYWQGFWQDDAEPDLDFYLKYFSPWLAHLLSNHRSLHLALQIFRKVNPWFIILSCLMQVFYFFPMGMYLYRDNSTYVMENLCGIILMSLQVAGAISVFAQQKSIQFLFNEVLGMLKQVQIDNQRQEEEMNRTHMLIYKTTKFVQIPAMVLYAITISYEYCFNLLPNRRQLIREWFPWNATSSPAFEITLFVRMLQLIFTWNCSCANIYLLSGAMVIPWLNLKILNNKFENIRDISMTRIKLRKLKELSEQVKESITQIDVFHPFGSALHEDQLRTERETLYLGSILDLHTDILIDQPGAVPAEPFIDGRTSRRVNDLALPHRQVTGRHQIESDMTAFTSFNPINMRLTTEYQSEDGRRSEHNSSETDQEMDINMEMMDVLAKNVVLHVRLIKYINLIARLINALMVVMFLDNTLALGVAAYIFMDDSKSNFKIIATIFALVIIGLYLAVNYMMQLISDQHAAVCESIYNSDWLEASPSFKKSMLVIMSRANQPLEIKPTGLDPLSLKNFREGMNYAYKMVNTLNNMVM